MESACVGSDVGQAVTNACRLSSIPLTTIALGNNPLALGNVQCDRHFALPPFKSESYVEALLEVCVKNQIDVLIPGHDDQALVLATNRESLEEIDTCVIAAQKEFISLCRDKLRLTQELSVAADIFVRGFNHQELADALQSDSVRLPVIAKPRSGFASNGVKLIHSADEIHGLDDNYIFQELAVPHSTDPRLDEYLNQLKHRRNAQLSEVSIQLVTGSDGRVVGNDGFDQQS